MKKQSKAVTLPERQVTLHINVQLGDNPNGCYAPGGGPSNGGCSGSKSISLSRQVPASLSVEVLAQLAAEAGESLGAVL